MKKKCLSLFVAIIAATALWANSQITYTAPQKLVETTSYPLDGINPNKFNAAIISHTFSDGTGIITFEGELTTIESYAFLNCTSLTSIILPNSIIAIGERAFYECSNLKTVTLPNSIETIETYLFYNCTSLSSITIPASVINIGYGAFIDCSALTSVIVPNSVQTIGKDAFRLVPNVVYSGTATGNPWGAKFLNGYVDGVFVYSDDTKTTLVGCSSAAKGEIQIPSTVTTIGNCAFEGCCNIASLEIPNSVDSIGKRAFSGCTGIISLVVPSSIAKIGSYAFQSVKNVVYSGSAAGAPWEAECINGYIEGNLVYADNTKTTLVGCPTTTTGEIKIPNSVDSINDNAFQYCNGITTINIPNSVKYIGRRAFSGCTSLTNVTLPANLTNISDNLFSGCINLSSITLPTSVKKIGYSAFGDCGMMSIDVPNGVEAIESFAFSRITNITYSGEATGAPWGAKCVNGYVDGIFAYSDNTKTTLIGCFSAAKGKIKIPNNVTKIGKNAFEYCREITNLQIPNSVRDIEEHAFMACNSLDSIVIPEGMKEIKNGVFSYCLSMTDISIPNSVTSIGDGAFNSCWGLKSIAIPDSVKHIGSGAFGTCTSLLSVTLPEGIENITDYTFAACTCLVSISIPNSVTSIEEGAFTVCSSLHSITIPSSVKSIGTNAFNKCSNLTSVYSLSVTPPICGTEAFNEVNKSIPVYVPSKSIDAYKAATKWKDFTNILPIQEAFDPSHPLNPGKYNVSATASPAEGGTISGTGEYAQGATTELTATVNTGYTFIGWADGEENATRSFTMPAHDTAFVANFKINSYLITFNNYDGTLLQSDSLTYGTMPQYTGSTPEKPSTKHWSYTFKTWNPQVVTVTQAATYTATYDSTLIALDTVIVTDEQNISDLQVGDITHIIVRETGKLTVDEPTEALSLTLYQTNTASAQIVNVSNLTVASADMVLRLEPTAEKATLAKWYAFGVPFEVEVASGIAKEGANSKAQSGYDFVIDNYDGALRATTQQGWKRCQSSDILQQGKFYMIAVNGTQNLWRFTKKASAAITEQTNLSVSQNTATSANHSGWNGLSNSLLQSAMASMQGLTYATIYRNATSTYETILLTQSALDASHPFFVQVAKSGSVLFSEATANAPTRMLAATTMDDNPIYTIAFQNKDYIDKAYLSLSETKANEYTIGVDVEKMQANTTSQPQLWLEAYGMQLAAHEARVEENAITTIPVGLYAPADGEYTLTQTLTQTQTIALLNKGSEVKPTMIDEEANTATWTLYLTRGTNLDYALQIGQRGIGTGVQNAECTMQNVEKVMIDGVLYIKRDGKMYNAQGGEL